MQACLRGEQVHVEVTETAPAQVATGAGSLSEPRQEEETWVRGLNVGCCRSAGREGAEGGAEGSPWPGLIVWGALCHPCADPGAQGAGVSTLGLTLGLLRGLRDYFVNNLF